MFISRSVCSISDSKYKSTAHSTMLRLLELQLYLTSLNDFSHYSKPKRHGFQERSLRIPQIDTRTG